MHQAVVALSEHYPAVLADRMTRALGVGWEQRERGRDRNPAREIVGVPDELIAEFSSRSASIEAEIDRLIDTYLTEHGHRPDTRTVLHGPTGMPARAKTPPQRPVTVAEGAFSPFQKRNRRQTA